jgi:hypothetical protein
MASVWKPTRAEAVFFRRQEPVIVVNISDVLDAMREPGCPVCRISRDRVARHLDRLLYEHVGDPGTRQEIRASLGLCNQHAWQLLSFPSSPGLGIAILYRDVLQELATALHDRSPAHQPTGLASALTGLRGWESGAPRLPSPEEACPICEYRDQIEARALGALLEALGEQGSQAETALGQSQGLCWAHLRLALSIEAPNAAHDFLLHDARRRVEDLDKALAEYIRHFDYQHAQTPAGSWKGAARRILAFIHGEPGVR